MSYRFFQNNSCAFTELETGGSFQLGRGDSYSHSLGFMKLTGTGLFFDPVLGPSFDYNLRTMALEMRAIIIRFDPMLPNWLGGGNSGIGDKLYFSKAYPLRPDMHESISFRHGHVVELSCKSR